MATDPIQRQMEPEGSTTKGVYQRIWKRWYNSIPGLSDNLPPKRDWRGDIKEYQGNMMYRAMVPVAIVKPMSDKGSAALVQYGVSISKVQPKFSIPGIGIPLNTLEIDGGAGWAYDKYQDLVGKARSQFIDKIANTSAFTRVSEGIIKDGVVVDPFKYEEVSDKLSRAMSLGRQKGIVDFLEWINGKTEIPGPLVDGKRIMIPVSKVVNKDDWMGFAKAYQKGRPIESDLYELPKRAVSPGAQDLIPF